MELKCFPLRGKLVPENWPRSSSIGAFSLCLLDLTAPPRSWYHIWPHQSHVPACPNVLSSDVGQVLFCTRHSSCSSLPRDHYLEGHNDERRHTLFMQRSIPGSKHHLPNMAGKTRGWCELWLWTEWRSVGLQNTTVVLGLDQISML